MVTGSWGTAAESDHIPKPVIKREVSAKARTVDDKQILNLLRDDVSEINKNNKSQTKMAAHALTIHITDKMEEKKLCEKWLNFESRRREEKT